MKNWEKFQSILGENKPGLNYSPNLFFLLTSSPLPPPSPPSPLYPFPSPSASQFNLNDLGLIEQIVCGHGRRFVGTYFSTFSAHIIMLRGYMSHSWLVKYEHLFWDRTLENLRKVHKNKIYEIISTCFCEK